jgi:hypothetical protein
MEEYHLSIWFAPMPLFLIMACNLLLDKLSIFCQGWVFTITSLQLVPPPASNELAEVTNRTIVNSLKKKVHEN